MGSFLIVIVASLFSISAQAVSQDGFFIDRLSAKTADVDDLNTAQQRKLERILQKEAKNVLSEPLAASRRNAATIIKPSLSASRNGAMLVLQRFDMGDLFSTIEVRNFSSMSEAEWSRICSRAVRDLVYGNFRQPTPEPNRPVASR